MPNRGYGQRPEHISRRWASIEDRIFDRFFSYIIHLDAGSRRELLDGRLEEAHAILADNDRLHGRVMAASLGPIMDSDIRHAQKVIAEALPLLSLLIEAERIEIVGEPATDPRGANLPQPGKLRHRPAETVIHHTHEHGRYGDTSTDTHSHEHAHAPGTNSHSESSTGHVLGGSPNHGRRKS